MVRPAHLEWRCRRGTRELDRLLQTWLHEQYDHADSLERQTFLELLDWQDDELARLLLGRVESANPEMNALAGKIRALSLSRP
ncbi:MAG: succinate dehydrogenase assembly factor 2 [Methylococcaceae bacterium]|nr:succinate dehydrogenase assembly factor 2 [Methylococcaceae bacterium]